MGTQPTPAIYQIDSTLPFAPAINRDLTNIQRGAQIIGPDQALAQAYSAAVASYAGDPQAGQVIAGTTIQVNAATTVQRMIYDDYMLAPVADRTLQSILDANPGPTGTGDWWNWSYNQWGVVPGVAADGSIKIATVLTLTNGVVTSVTGVLEP